MPIVMQGLTTLKICYNPHSMLEFLIGICIPLVDVILQGLTLIETLQ